MDTLRNYTFLPWTRRGFGAEITDARRPRRRAAPGPERAAVPVSFNVNGQPIAKHVRGPRSRRRRRHQPARDRQDRTAQLGDRLRIELPALHRVLRRGFSVAIHAGHGGQRARPEPRCVHGSFWSCSRKTSSSNQKARRSVACVRARRTDSIPASFFRAPDQSWAWAHVHVSQNIIGNTLQTTDATGGVAPSSRTSQQTLRANADVASSRLLCARKLEDNTAYHAFVIPAFETGRLRGTGIDIPPSTSGQRSSWDDGQRLYPIYYRWFFRTGEKGDFEFLVDLLEPRPVDKRVGVRAMDMQNPGYEVEGMSGPLRVMGLEGALKSPETESSPGAMAARRNGLQQSARRLRRTFPERARSRRSTCNSICSRKRPPTTRIPIRSSARRCTASGMRWPRGWTCEQGTGWVNELNRDPRLRTPAGAGTQVIQKEQEKFMQQAWAQLGDLLQANQKIRQLQLAWMSSVRERTGRTSCRKPTDQLLTFTQAVQTAGARKPDDDCEAGEGEPLAAGGDRSRLSQDRTPAGRDHAEGRARRHGRRRSGAHAS